MKKKHLLTYSILLTIIIAVASAALWLMRETPKPALETLTATPSSLSTPAIKLPHGLVVESIDSGNLQKFEELFSISTVPTAEIDNKLSQVIFSLDKKIPEKEGALKIQQIFDVIYNFSNSYPSLTPREIVLLSKIFGKINDLPLDKKKNLKNLYFKKKWLKTNYWLDASIQWSKADPATLSQLHSLLNKSRSDLFQDYFYYLSHMKDTTVQKKLISSTRSKLKFFPSSLQKIGLAQLDQLEKSSL